MKNVVEDLLKIKKLKSQEYHSVSKYYFDKFSIKLPKSKMPKIWSIIHFKQYLRFKHISLSKPLDITVPLSDAIKERVSVRKYSKESMTFDDLSTLLKLSAGLKKHEKNFNLTRRGYPSAGARYPVEIYVICLNCSKLNRGIYHYNVKQNTLEVLREHITRKELRKCFDQPWMFSSSCIILISAVFGRTNIKYSERGYRYVLLDTGHMAQNICLVSTALGLGTCCIGGFHDDELNKLLDIQEDNEAVVYNVVIGHVARS